VSFIDQGDGIVDRFGRSDQTFGGDGEHVAIV
jgi:hypothetical protein